MLKKRQFAKDFQTHMRMCERNYDLLMRLLPSLSDRDGWLWPLDDDGQRTVQVNIVKREKFTTTLAMAVVGSSRLGWTDTAPMVVRLYHDAHMAEVLKNEIGRQLESHYRYPNEHMFQQDEKLQRNQFLNRVLEHCKEAVLCT